MYGGGGGGGGSSGGKKQRPATGYLVRPRLGALRSLYSSRPFSAYATDKKRKLKKSVLPKMDWRKRPDYADTAYREAVGRLRILLAESYAPIKRPLRELDSAGEETDNQSLVSAGSRNSRMGRSYYHYTPITPRKYHYYPPLRGAYNVMPTEGEKPLPEPPKPESSSAPPELMSFIERQEEYIEQLEKESRFCREELSSLLSKVKDVISENENLHEKQKSKLIKSVFDHLETETETETETENKNLLKSPKKTKKTRIIEGPSIVFESRISELEAQLTQARIDLKKALDENDSYKRKINDGTILESAGYESYKKQIDHLQREKETLQDNVNKLQNALAILRDKENDTCDKVKRSLDVAEQAQYEKNAAESEIRRLKDELERQHLKLRDTIAEQGRRVADERAAVERRYTQQIEQLTAELGVQWETTNKMQLEMDKQRRENADLRREVTQKQALIDELKKDMQNKIITLQTDIGVSGAEKSALEQQISTLQMANERSERQLKQEIARLQVEIQSLRQRLDRADADLIHSRRENIRLTEQVACLEKEINLNAALSEERSKTPRGGEIVALPPPTPKKEDREKELTSMIHDMENKHAATVAELETMIYSQNQLMDKLSTDCHILTQKLEDASFRHKEEIRELQTSLEFLNNKFIQSQMSTSKTKDKEYVATSNQRNTSPQPTKTQAQPEREILSRKSSASSFKPKISSRQSSRDKLQAAALPPHQQSQQATKTKTKLPSSASKERLANISKPEAKDEHPPETREQNQYDRKKQSVSKQEQHKDPTSQLDPNQKIVDDDPQYARQPDRQYAGKTEQQYVSQPEQQYASQPDQQYTVQSDQQYAVPPDRKYSGQADQQYTGQPDQQYTVPPDQQYTVPADQQFTGAAPDQQYTSQPDQPYTHQNYEPNAQFDPNQVYDPNQDYGPSQQYDPNQPYDVSGQYDPNQQYGGQQEYDPNQYEQYEEDASRQYADDPNQQYAENLSQQYDIDPSQMEVDNPQQFNQSSSRNIDPKDKQ